MYQDKVILICENTLDGIFTAVYDGWRFPARGTDVEIRTKEPENFELFCRFMNVKTSEEKAVKVLRTIRRSLGMNTYEAVCHAVLADDAEKGTSIFYVLYGALGQGRCNPRIMESLADTHVRHVAELHKKVWNEIHHYFGFVRFQEMGAGVMLSVITPRHDVLTMLGPHFSNRFPGETWIIYDNSRKKALLHPKGGRCQIRQGISLNLNYGTDLSEEGEYEQLWREFCRSITIEERKNEKLQKQLLPLRFRPNMTEF
ncbi:MAG: TIGR03915 family putative DNA repair protein [Blautia sp.]|nr:TIGR03915 family putative DNA repair protein [Blautia sp.]